MIKKAQNHQGFTLIEVIVSLALIGITAVSIMMLFSTSLQNNMASKEIIEDAVYGKDIMEKVKKEFILLSPGSRDIDGLQNKAIEIQIIYPNSIITISTKDSEKKLYIIEVTIPGGGEGSDEKFVSQMHLP